MTTNKLRHKGAAVAERGKIHVKTYVFTLDDAQSGLADAEVNDFSDMHGCVSMVLDRFNDKMLYRILYRDED